MERRLVLKYLRKAVKDGKSLKITTSKEKVMQVNVIGYEKELVKYTFLNSNEISYIKLENIAFVKFIKKEDEEDFKYQMLNEKYCVANLKEEIENFCKYYMEIIEVLLSNEEEGTKGYINLKKKKDMYPRIFRNLIKDENNLLFYYFTKNRPKNLSRSTNVSNEKKEQLLIEQANLSQKKSLDNALNERISIIEGPPGTGKTTTILNILANLIYQNKKVLVVSKNNSAIENVEEELDKMNIPKCYIRMRKFRYYEGIGTNSGKTSENTTKPYK